MRLFFSTSNYGVYFYLLGSLIYFFQALKSDDMDVSNMILILSMFVVTAMIFVFKIAPLHDSLSKSKNSKTK